ncbi:hypothetical protein [Streptomyces antibioticus]|uniref:hypothetical protein n=1 Tax=Streptomyces antibioticus TaxID=1890 RepID=UPI0033D2F8FD
MNAEERKLRATLGAHISWANTTDRTARTAPGARAAEARFEKQARELHPDANEDFIAKVAENLRKAHYARMGMASAAKRRKDREAQPGKAA